MAPMMNSAARRKTARALASLDAIPILYEDEDEGDMGESNPHVVSDGIIHLGIASHLADRPRYGVYSNMNLYYRKKPLHRRTKSRPYVSPDIMVVETDEPLAEDIASYTVGQDGPAPKLTVEILSKRSAQQQDLKKKPKVYARLGVDEYILVDRTGDYLPERLLLKRLQTDGSWKDEQDGDGGVTSQLGFRIIWDTDGALRVLDVKTGMRYTRPEEAQGEANARRDAEQAAQREADARRDAEQRIRALEAEIERLRESSSKKPNNPRGRKP